MSLSYDNKPSIAHDEFALGSASVGLGEQMAPYEPGGAEEKVGGEMARHLGPLAHLFRQAFMRKLDYRLIPVIWCMYVMVSHGGRLAQDFSTQSSTLSFSLTWTEPILGKPAAT